MHDVFFGLYLLEKGIVDRPTLTGALERQRPYNQCLGELAIARGHLAPEQADEIFAAQAADRRQFGTIAVDSGYLSTDDLDDLLFLQAVHCRRLGEVLLADGALSEPRYSELLHDFHEREARQRAELRAHLDARPMGRELLAMACALTLALARFGGVVGKPVAGVAPMEPDGACGSCTIIHRCPGAAAQAFRFCFPRMELGLAGGGCAASGSDDWLEAACCLLHRADAYFRRQMHAPDAAAFGPDGCRSGAVREDAATAAATGPGDSTFETALLDHGAPDDPDGVTLVLGFPDGREGRIYVYPPVAADAAPESCLP
jgi:hypothetical protein